MLTGCTFGDEPSVCPYNIRLEYWYAGSNVENTLPIYVDNLRQFLFDGEGKLVATTTLQGDSITGWSGELPDGRYTVVLWGNLGDENKMPVDILPENNASLNEMSISAVTEGVPPGFRGNTGRLYYGTATFEVENGVTLRQRVYLSHAHAVLTITVRWMADAPPEGGTYRMRLKGIPAVYGFTGQWENTTPGGDGVYTIPRIGGVITYHETKASMNFDGEVNGEFVTFRYMSGTHQMWSLWRDGVQIVKELDLNSFFQKIPMDMNTNMEQEFDLLVTVYKDKIIVTQSTAADWDEGGTIG
ncbi:FimB/Mfa2 family fimbrial subunit [Parabacteroides sp.]